MTENIADFREARIRQRKKLVSKALGGLNDEDKKWVIEEALRMLDSDLKLTVKPE